MRGAGWGIAVVAAGLSLAGCGSGTQPTGRERLVVTPRASLLDQPLRVVARGLRAGSMATLRASWRSYDGVVWAGAERIRAGRDGTALVAGGRLLEGLVPNGKPRDGFFFPSASASAAVPLRLTLTVGGAVAARATVRRGALAPSVRMRRLTVGRDGLLGYFYAARSQRRRPALLAIGGSDGGIPLSWAELLASHGYPTLALAYFHGPGVPRTLKRIPLEYFARGLRWLARQPGVDARRLVVNGVSRGGEGSLLIASTFPRLVHGVIAMVPNYETWPAGDPSGGAAWTYGGRGVPPYTMIPVERMRGPVLLVGAGEDASWNSSGSVVLVARALRQAHFRWPVRRIVIPHAGHDVSTGIPYLPADPVRDTFGGTLAATNAGKPVIWRAVLDYLRSMSSTR